MALAAALDAVFSGIDAAPAPRALPHDICPKLALTGTVMPEAGFKKLGHKEET